MLYGVLDLLSTIYSVLHIALDVLRYTQYIYSIIYSAAYIGGGGSAFESACFLAAPPRFVFPRKQCETNVLHAEHFQDFVVVPLQIFFNFFLFLCIFTRRCE